MLWTIKSKITPGANFNNLNLRETELHCDARSIEFGAMCVQKGNDISSIVSYFSKRTSDAESRYELETLAII